MAPGGPVDRADNRSLNVEQVHQQMPTFPMDAVDPLDRRAGWEGRGPRGGARPRKLRARPGENYDAVFAVGGDIVKGLGQFAMWQEPPAQRLPLGVQSDLQDAVAALHAHRLVFIRIFVE